MHTYVKACDSTQGCTDTGEKVCTESGLWEKNSLAALESRTCIRGVLVRCSTSCATSPPCSVILYPIQFEVDLIPPFAKQTTHPPGCLWHTALCFPQNLEEQSGSSGWHWCEWHTSQNGYGSTGIHGLWDVPWLPAVCNLRKVKINMMATLSSLARIWGECSTNLSPPMLFFFFSWSGD